MYRFTVLLALTVLCASLAGCVAKVWTTTQDAIPHRNTPVRVFGPDEYPVFVIANAGGKVAGLAARDRRTGIIVDSVTDRRLSTNMEHVRMPGLPAGPYTAELHVDNDHADTWAFEIAERVVDRRESDEINPPLGIRDRDFLEVKEAWGDLSEGSINAIMAIIRAR